jgi:hypothetical protein
MKYKQALKEKNVKKEDLSKSLQKKIDALEELVNRLEEATDEQKEENAELVEETDAAIAKTIRKFNPDVQAKRIEAMKAARGEKEKSEEIAQYIANEEEDEQLQDEPKAKVEAKVVEIPRIPEQLKPSPKQPFVQEVEEEEVEEEIEDFEKKKVVRPKGVSVSFMLMGVGAFLLTWGAVNLWRTKHR